MKVTSAEAGKLVKKLEEKISALQALEDKSSVFRVASGEDEELLRPAYDFAECQKKLDSLQADLRKVKHALNVFNSTHSVPGFGMTIDQMLVYIPQLSQRKMKLRNMAGVLQKARVKGRSAVNSAVIEYTYANYDVEEAKAAADAAAEELARAQTALDKVNNTETMEIDL